MIVVVGAGITGLAVGRELDRLGSEFLVLEASSRPGGVIRSAEVEGRILDWGPQRIRLTARMVRLVEQLGLQEQVMTSRSSLDLSVYRDRRLRQVPFTPRRFLTSDIVSPVAKLRLLLEPLTRGADPDERVSTYFRRKLGGELYETLAAPLYGGLYGSDPADMEVGLSLIHLLRDLGIRRSLVLRLLRRRGRISPPPVCTFRDGMRVLPKAMAAVLGDRLRLEAPVRSLEATTSGWRVLTEDGFVDARSVVLTTPAAVTSAILSRAAPAAAAAVGALRYNTLGIVHLDAETDLKGRGFQVAFTEAELSLLGVTFNDSLFGRPDLYTAYLGGARRPEVADMDEETLATLARRQFRICTGYGARVLSVDRERMPAWDVTWRALEGLKLPDNVYLAANWWSRPGLPGRLAEAERVARSVTGRVSLESSSTPSRAPRARPGTRTPG